jgi:quercetin dioxygenase-like cupin family protein
MLPATVRYAVALGFVVSFSGCDNLSEPDPAAYESYEIVSSGTRQYEWDTDTGPGIIKVLIEESNLGSKGAEVAEIWFPPGYEGTSHPHELEIIYVVEGELDHIVNGESHILQPGMIGVVRERDRVVHKTHSPDGVKTLVIWPLGKEVEGFEASGMRKTTPGN